MLRTESDRGRQVKGLREIVLIHDLKKQGLSISAIARKVGSDRKTVRKYLDRGLEAPVYGPRQPRARVVEPYERYLQERVQAFPDLSGARLLREIRELGYDGGYTAVTDFLREVRPARQAQFERRFETPPGKQAQVDFAEFTVDQGVSLRVHFPIKISSAMRSLSAEAVWKRAGRGCLLRALLANAARPRKVCFKTSG